MKTQDHWHSLVPFCFILPCQFFKPPCGFLLFFKIVWFKTPFRFFKSYENGLLFKPDIDVVPPPACMFFFFFWCTYNFVWEFSVSSLWTRCDSHYLKTQTTKFVQCNDRTFRFYSLDVVLCVFYLCKYQILYIYTNIHTY